MRGEEKGNGEGPACLKEGLAQAAVGRDPHHAGLKGAGQLRPDFFQ